MKTLYADACEGGDGVLNYKHCIKVFMRAKVCYFIRFNAYLFCVATYVNVIKGINNINSA